MDLAGYVADKVADRRATGTASGERQRFSTLIDGTLDGERKLTDAEIVRIAHAGALGRHPYDGASLCNMIAYLAGNRQLQRPFFDQPDLRDPIIDERSSWSR